jgi:LIM domain kinase 1
MSLILWVFYLIKIIKCVFLLVWLFLIFHFFSKILFNFKDYIAGGTLKNLIHDLSIPLTWLQRLRYAKDIASGMVKLPKMVFLLFRFLFLRNIFIYVI